MKKALIWLAIAIVMVIGCSLVKNLIAKSAVTSGVKGMTGLTLDIGSMDVRILKSTVGITDLRLHNPAGFPDRFMADVPNLSIHYDLGAFFRRRVHLKELRLDLKQFTVIKDQAGCLNLDSLKVVRSSKEGTSTPAEKPTGSPPAIEIDRLQLKVGTVVYKDYSGGGQPQVREFAVNLDERYEHITDPQALAALIVTRALMNTAVAQLTGLDLTALQSQVGAQLQQAGQATMATARQLGTQAVGVTKGVRTAAQGTVVAGQEAVGQGVEAAKQTGEWLKDTTHELQKGLKNLIGQ